LVWPPAPSSPGTRVSRRCRRLRLPRHRRWLLLRRPGPDRRSLILNLGWVPRLHRLADSRASHPSCKPRDHVRETAREKHSYPVVPHHSSPSVVPPRARSRLRNRHRLDCGPPREARWRGPADPWRSIPSLRARECLSMVGGSAQHRSCWRMCPREPVSCALRPTAIQYGPGRFASSPISGVV
jgi:hypothetical protein